MRRRWWHRGWLGLKSGAQEPVPFEPLHQVIRVDDNGGDFPQEVAVGSDLRVEVASDVGEVVESLIQTCGDVGQARVGIRQQRVGVCEGLGQLPQTLADANALLTNSDARLTDVATSLDQTLDNLANITSNLNAQVRANSNLLGEISTIIIHTDDLVQGLKRHWLLRSAFKAKPATVPPTATHPKAMSPKASER